MPKKNWNPSEIPPAFRAGLGILDNALSGKHTVHLGHLEYGLKYLTFNSTMSDMYYLIITAQITDPIKFKSYAIATGQYVAELGGEYVVRAGQTEILEGEFDLTSKIVISRWRSKEHALSFWQSEKYQNVLKPLRENTGSFTVLLIEGS